LKSAGRKRSGQAIVEHGAPKLNRRRARPACAFSRIRQARDA
jgi:hypothetical protein